MQSVPYALYVEATPNLRKTNASEIFHIQGLRYRIDKIFTRKNVMLRIPKWGTFLWELKQTKTIVILNKFFGVTIPIRRFFGEIGVMISEKL